MQERYGRPRYGSSKDHRGGWPIGNEASTETGGRLWYQRTRLWVVVALVAHPLAFGWFILGVVLFDGSTVFGLFAGVTLAFAPIALWMGVLVAKHAWARWVLVFCTALLFIVTVVAVISFHAEAVYEARGESLEDGSFRRDLFLAYLSSGVFWVGPLVVLYALRKRFQPDDRQQAPPRLVEVSGWMMMAWGYLVLVLALASLTKGGNRLDLVGVLILATWVGVPVLSGGLMVRRGRRRHTRDTSTPDHTQLRLQHRFKQFISRQSLHLRFRLQPG